MRRVALFIIGLVFAVICVGIAKNFSFPLQDGYRLQGGLSSHGHLYRGYLFSVISEEVMGVQGSKKGFIYGCVAESGRQFIVNTKTAGVEWHDDAVSFSRALAKYGCPAADMSKEVNLAGLREGFRKFSSE